MKFLVFGIYLCLLISCHQSNSFNTTSWTEQSKIGRYPKRKFIIGDLIKNYKLRGLTYRELIELLGDPFPKELFKIDTLYYPIDIRFNQKNQLIGAKSLILKVGRDSIVRDFKILEWGK